MTIFSHRVNVSQNCIKYTVVIIKILDIQHSLFSQQLIESMNIGTALYRSIRRERNEQGHHMINFSFWAKWDKIVDQVHNSAKK